MIWAAAPATSPSWSGQLPGMPMQFSVPTVEPVGYSTRYSGDTALALVCVGNGLLIGVWRYRIVPVSASYAGSIEFCPKALSPLGRLPADRSAAADWCACGLVGTSFAQAPSAKVATVQA